MYATYTTIVPMLVGLPQTTTATGWTKIVANITRHITRAEAIVNAAIANRYNTAAAPFNAYATTPPLLRMITEDIASYYTYRGEFSADGQNVNEWTDKYKESQSLLFEIRDGRLDLTDTTGSAITETYDVIGSNTEDYTPTFNEGSATSWEVDADK